MGLGDKEVALTNTSLLSVTTCFCAGSLDEDACGCAIMLSPR